MGVGTRAMVWMDLPHTTQSEYHSLLKKFLRVGFIVLISYCLIKYASTAYNISPENISSEWAPLIDDFILLIWIVAIKMTFSCTIIYIYGIKRSVNCRSVKVF